MVFTRSSIFVVIAFVLCLLAALVAGGVIVSSVFAWPWLVCGALTSYFLSMLVP